MCIRDRSSTVALTEEAAKDMGMWKGRTDGWMDERVLHVWTIVGAAVLQQPLQVLE